MPEVLVDGRRVSLTTLDRVLYPEAGYTKAQVLDYYARVAPALLAHLAGRPMTLKRYPEGVDGPHFYDKHCSGAPPWVEVAPVWSERKGADVRFCRLEDRASVLWSVNRGNLEMHPLLSVASDPDTPTALVFDLDPGEPATIIECCRVGLALQGMFENLGLQSFAKTSGSKGLQLYLPLNSPDVTYEQTKPFAKAVAELLEGAEPELVVSRMTKSRRRGKVLIDWSQNDARKTTVCVYSLRAAEQPTVSTPLEWQEVRSALSTKDPAALSFRAPDVLDRVARMGDLFAPVLSLVQQLPAV
jgi:bifunctional non-homologous end joining protein LigD